MECRGICFANKMGIVSAPLMSVPWIASNNAWQLNPIAMQMPIGLESSFQGVIDLMVMKAVYWDDELGREPREADIP